MDYKLLKDKTILYVEDDTSISTSFTPILKKIFHTVYVGSNGIEGLQLFKQHNDIEIIVTDIKMPKMDGLEMCSHIKDLKPNIPCIIVTAHAEEKYLKEADKLEVYGYIFKPLDIQELLDKVVEYFQTKS